MTKTILLSYKHCFFIPFGEGYRTVYELTMLRSSWFGLIKKEVKQTYSISMFESVDNHTEHWDKLIKDKTNIK